jgi:hypothetical protein
MGGLFDDLIEEAEGVRDRVRNQARERRPPGGPRRGAHRSHRRSAEADADVEAELRRDEAADASSGRAGSQPTSPSTPPSSPDSTSESASEDAQAFARDPDPERARPRAAELFPQILGWQPLVLNRALECGRCDRRLSAGESAFLGVAEQGLTQVALCGRCAGTR